MSWAGGRKVKPRTETLPAKGYCPREPPGLPNDHQPSDTSLIQRQLSCRSDRRPARRAPLLATRSTLSHSVCGRVAGSRCRDPATRPQRLSRDTTGGTWPRELEPLSTSRQERPRSVATWPGQSPPAGETPNRIALHHRRPDEVPHQAGQPGGRRTSTSPPTARSSPLPKSRPSLPASTETGTRSSSRTVRWDHDELHRARPFSRSAAAIWSWKRLWTQ